MDKNIMPETFRQLQSEGLIKDADVLKTEDGFWFIYKSLSDILCEKGIVDFPDSAGERLECGKFYDDWFLYAITDADEETYITMFMVILDPETGECEYINVGHSVSPIVLNGGKIHELFVPGVPICRWDENAGSELGRVKIEKGDRIAIFTDGVMERCERIDSEKFFCDNFARRNFDASEFIQEVKTIHVKNRADDILLMICERTA